MNVHKLYLKIFVVIFLQILVFQQTRADSNYEGLWQSAGQNIHNTRFQQKEKIIGTDNVDELSMKWFFETGGDISATPAVDRDFVYFPDWDGNLYKLDKRTGKKVWSRKLDEYIEIPPTITAKLFSRVTPAIHGNMLILGDQGGRLGLGATLLAVNKHNGKLIWKTKLDNHPRSIITQSAVVFNNIAYVGISSDESYYEALTPGYQCCTFRGSIVAVNVKSGKIIWKTYMTPETPAREFPRFSGNSVWGSTPVVDTERGRLYVTTGNNYSVDQRTLDCVREAYGDPAATRACNPADNLFDSVVALNLMTGEVIWGRPAIPYDAWTASCLGDVFPGGGNPENCQDPSGPDYDFGQGPMLFETKTADGKESELLGIGQKSGRFWALDPDSGDTVWVTQVGPGGVVGGIQWGSATDGKRIYVAVSNSQYTLWNMTTHTIVPQPDDGTAPVCPTGDSCSIAGLWSALDPATGAILWQTADPNDNMDQAAVSIANGVVYVGSMADTPPNPKGVDHTAPSMFALDAVSGKILWSYSAGSAVNAGAAIVDGMVFWGSGYSLFGSGNNKFFAFGLKEDMDFPDEGD